MIVASTISLLQPLQARPLQALLHVLENLLARHSSIKMAEFAWRRERPAPARQGN